jgi:glycosyltransferase involved in cell wall biosynthesis
MRILLITQIVPYPPDSGPKIKTYHVLRYLAERGHRVTLASFVRQHEEAQLTYLQPYCEKIHPISFRRSRLADAIALADSFRTGLPFLVLRDANREMRRLIDNLATQPFDIVHADQLTMAQFALQFRDAARTNSNRPPLLVFDAHNAVHEIVKRTRQTAPFFLRPILAPEENRLKRYEGQLVQQFDRTLAVSQIDKDDLLSASAAFTTNNRRQTPPQSGNLGTKINVIPIAVDCAALHVVTNDGPSNNIISASTLFYPPNADGVRWFAREVFPLVRARVPNVTWTVAGPRPPQDVIKFGTQNPENVQVTGYVPDLEPFYARAALTIVPVRAGSGMRVRILEALARGVPVVTTTTGVEGIDAVSGEHLLIADNPPDFASAVVQLLENRELLERIKRNGRRLVEEKYDWRVVLPKLESAYQLSEPG